MNYQIKKGDFDNLISHLIENYTIIAPTKNKRFEVLTNPEKLDLKHLPSFPIRHFLNPRNEPLYQLKDNKPYEVKLRRKTQIYFGIRQCDLNAIRFLDKFFEKDPHYQELRKNTIIIGYICPSSFKNCFCKSLGAHIPVAYDILIQEKSNKFIIEIKNSKSILPSRLLKKTNEKIKVPSYLLQRKIRYKDIRDHLNSKIWRHEAEKCTSCALCNITCSTCFCFDIIDIPNLQYTDRIRVSDSCQLKSFTQIGGNYTFRAERKDRLRHRLLCKLEYTKNNQHLFGCVGCGRCIDNCPAKIDMIDIMDKLK